MASFNFTPVFKDILKKTSDDLLSTAYYGEHLNKKILILKFERLSLLMVLNYNVQSLNCNFLKGISTRGRHISGGTKIVGSDDIILLLDDAGSLWRLINAFQFSKSKNECLYLLERNCFYEWVSFTVFKFEKVLQITALEKGFACIGINKNNEKKLKFFTSLTSSHLKEFNLEYLSLTEAADYFLSTFKANIFHSVLNENFEPTYGGLIISGKGGATIFWSPNEKICVLNVSNTPLVNFINYEDENCVMLSFQSGKLIFFLYDNLNNFYSKCVVFLSKKLLFIKKCTFCKHCFLWSDGVNLHHTNIKFQQKKSYFVKLVHLEVQTKVKGLLCLLKVDVGFIGITANDFYYHISKNVLRISRETQLSFNELAKVISDSSFTIKVLNEKIKIKIKYLKTKEVIQQGNLKKDVDLKIVGEHIMLKSRIKMVLEKNYWKVKLLAAEKNRHFVELIHFKEDLIEGMAIKIETGLLVRNEINVSLIGNFGEDFELLILDLGKVVTGKVKEHCIGIWKNMSEVALNGNKK